MKKYLIFTIIAFIGISAYSGAVNAQNYTFSTNLLVGSSGSDVVHLQTWLISNSFDIPAISSGIAAKGYFGSQTKLALIKYQQSLGFPAFGYFGPMTRGYINGHTNPDNASFKVISPNGGEVWVKGTTQNITWSGSSNVLAQKGDIKLEFPVPACAQPGQIIRCMIMVRAPITVAQSIDLNSRSYSWYVGNQQGVACIPEQPSACEVPDGQYKIQICPADGSACAESVSNFTVTGSTSAGPLKITSPNGGEVWTKGTTQNITWTSPYYLVATTAEFKLIPYQAPCTTQVCPAIAYAPYTIATNIPINQNSYSWNVGKIQTYLPTGADISSTPIAPDGQYTIQICQTGTSNCDSSGGLFTINSTQTLNGISVVSPGQNDIWVSNSTHQIVWTYANADINSKVDLNLGYLVMPPCISSAVVCNPIFQKAYTLDKNIVANATYNWIVGTDINNNQIQPGGAYVVQVCKAGTSVCSNGRQFVITVANSGPITDLSKCPIG